MSDEPIRSMNEFKKRYYPDLAKCERERIAKMSAQELGEYLAEKSLRDLRTALGLEDGDNE